MTIGEIVSLIRGRIRQYQDDTIFTDQLLWQNFLVERSEIIANYRVRRFNYINDHSYQTVCIKLEKANSHDCSCIEKGCKVMKSVFKLPRYFTGRNTPLLRIYTIGYNQIPQILEFEYESIYQKDDIFKDKPMYSIVNGKILLYNADFEVLLVRALWYDVTELSDIQYCKGNGGVVDCIDVFSIDASIDEDLLSMTLDKVIERLQLPLTIQQDESSDNNETIKI